MDGIDEKRYLISIDGGGTNTGVCIYDRLQDISRTKIIGGGNYKTHGIEIVRKRIQTCLQNMLPEIDDIPASTLFLVMGLSGCDSQRDLDIYAEMMQELGFLPEQMMICNDSEMIFRALRSVIRDPDTGSVRRSPENIWTGSTGSVHITNFSLVSGKR